MPKSRGNIFYDNSIKSEKIREHKKAGNGCIKTINNSLKRANKSFPFLGVCLWDNLNSDGSDTYNVIANVPDMYSCQYMCFQVLILPFLTCHDIIKKRDLVDL